MRRLTSLTAAVLAMGLAAHAATFSEDEKAVLRARADEARAALAAAEVFGHKAITLLPVSGDRDGYCERLVLDALVNAGRTAVVSNDDKADERFRRILREIRWDAGQTRLNSLDPETIDELGRLKSTQVLLEARLDLTRPGACGKKKEKKTADAPAPLAELSLLAYEVEPKQFIWSATFVTPPPPPPDAPAPVETGRTDVKVVPLRLSVLCTPANESASRVAGQLETNVRGTLAALGYLVETGEADDMTVTLFDQSGNYLVFDGEVKARVDVAGVQKSLVGETAVAARGVRGLGVVAADRNLGDALAEQVLPWLKRTLKPDAVAFEAVTFTLRRKAPVATGEDLAFLADVRQALSETEGVRTCALVEQDNARGTFVMRVVYEKAAFPLGFVNAFFASHPTFADGE